MVVAIRDGMVVFFLDLTRNSSRRDLFCLLYQSRIFPESSRLCQTLSAKPLFSKDL